MGLLIVVVAFTLGVGLVVGLSVASGPYSDRSDGVFSGVLAAVFAGILAGAAASTYLNFARFDGEAACKAQRMDAIARPMSADVVCIPYPTRQDTTTINANVKQN